MVPYYRYRKGKPTMTDATTTRTACPTTNQTLTQKQKAGILEWIKELTNEGRHLEASTLYTEYFGLI